MTALEALTAAQILAIPDDEPERLFTPDGETIKRNFRRLALRWHPDTCGDAEASLVFEHVKALYELARARLDAGAWKTPGLLTISGENGKSYRIRYVKNRPFELGQEFLGEHIVAWQVGTSDRDLFDTAVATISAFHFSDDAMRREMTRFLPGIRKSIASADNTTLVIDKEADLVPLRDVLRRMGGKLEPVHVAWILSGAFNIASYLSYSGLVHNAIGPDTLFISPARHAVALIGGWWYAARQGDRLRAAPARTLSLMPSDIARRKIADYRTDLEAIRLTGRELLGDATGMRLTRNPSVPTDMSRWLRQASAGDARSDYAAWKDILGSSFGKSRFVPLDVDITDIYN